MTTPRTTRRTDRTEIFVASNPHQQGLRLFEAKNIVEELLIEFPSLLDSKIRVIKAVRKGVGCGLKDAKDLCDAAWELSKQVDYGAMNAYALEQHLKAHPDELLDALLALKM